jgi:hypothetical protein
LFDTNVNKPRGADHELYDEDGEGVDEEEQQEFDEDDILKLEKLKGL